MSIRTASVVLVLLSLSAAHGQQNPDPSNPAVAATRAWALLTDAVASTVRADQVAAIRSLGVANTPPARRLIEDIARSTSHPLRSLAVGSLFPGDVTYISLIAEALRASDLEVRRAAIQHLRWIRDSRVLPLLRTEIMRGDADTIEYAISSAQLLGSMSLEMLVQAVPTVGERGREPVIRCIEWMLSSEFPESTGNLAALRRLRPEPVLRNALIDSNQNVRSFAALILARLGDAAALDELLRIAGAPDPRFGTIVSRHYAMAALHALGRPEYLAPLAAALRDKEQRVRLDAAMAMRSFASPSMFDVWNEIWRGDSPSDVRYWAFHGLLAIRDTDTGLMRAGLVDRESGIRLRAAERLLALGSDSASLEVLERLAADPATRNLALSFLSKSGDVIRTARVARSLLPKTVEDIARIGSQQIYDPKYLSAVGTLATVEDAEAVPALDAMLALRPDSELTFAVTRALAAIGTDEARRTLVRAMDNPSSVVRIYAAGGLLTQIRRDCRSIRRTQC